VSKVPQVTLRTTVDGREETLSEYICDWPDCPNGAVKVVGFVAELRIRVVLSVKRSRSDPASSCLPGLVG
jgi:hypothetical protein